MSLHDNLSMSVWCLWSYQSPEHLSNSLLLTWLQEDGTTPSHNIPGRGKAAEAQEKKEQ